MILKAATSQPKNDYPTSDGKPMAETDIHRDLMLELIETLKWWFRDEPSTYVSGNLLIFYEKGDKRKHVSPDVFVVPKVGNYRRDNYLLWEERPLELVIELTSKTTMIEDIEEKYNLYVEKLGVKEYFLFDPKQEYLKPSFQGYRKASGRFVAIKPVGERLPSKVLGLHLERDGDQLRLWNPATGERVPTPAERLAQAESAAMRANELAAENERLQQELARLRGKK